MYSGKRRGENGIGAIIDFLLSNARLVLGVGGVAVLGIATLAVKKLIERAGRPPDDANPEKKTSEGWEELSSPKLLQKGIEGVVIKQIAAATQKDLSQSTPQNQSQTRGNGSDPSQSRRRLDLCVFTFSERLEQYYRTRACLPPSEVSRAQQKALDIATEIQAFLHSKHPDMPLGEMTLAGRCSTTCRWSRLIMLACSCHCSWNPVFGPRSPERTLFSAILSTACCVEETWSISRVGGAIGTDTSSGATCPPNSLPSNYANP
ncbi:hypothetical protein HF521_013139 [Silurus meridionalis]|uniref:Mitochondrial dynamics protein MID51-like C-terminal domain-containing protein n=1 Tax=Silurus meridionalis TaxID=175797 RepID=A0A8T0AGN0_SILME|nr:hypothetical protein HF521_013139 [Silurus meridionalis]